MSDRAKKLFKSIWRTLLSCLITAVVFSILYYAVNGWQISGDMRAKAENNRVVSVTITHNGDTVTITDPEQMELAAGCALMLRVTLPGKSTDVTPDTELVFTMTNGKTVQIGATDTLVIKDGKAYSPKGKGGCIKVFRNSTEGIFFLDKAVEAHK